MAPRPATTDGSGRMHRSSSMGNLNVTGKAVDRTKNSDEKSLAVAKQQKAAQRRRPVSAREQRRSVTTAHDEKAVKSKNRPTTAFSSDKVSFSYWFTIPTVSL